jgi:D-3-phosphoglycerate dehydrogenase / 2-oxoglutarate reductase
VSRFRVLTLNNIASVGLKRLPPDQYAHGNDLPEPDAVLVRSHDMHAMTIGPTVLAVGRAGAGTNNIPVAALSARGIPVFNAPGANANAVNELVLAAMLIACRKLVPAIEFVRGLPQAGDEELGKLVESGKKHFSGVELPNRTLGIIGLGAIGSRVAATAIGHGMQVLGYDPDITVDAAWRLPHSVVKAHSVEEVMKRSDFVSLHVPLVPATRHLVDADRLAVMRRGAILLNFARDGLVDDDAVAAALESGRLGAYLSDFPSARLRGVQGVVSFPHLGASSQEAEENCAVMVVDQLRGYLEHGNIVNSVNFPGVEMPRESPYRVGIANANVPNMLSQISAALAHADLNIHNMINKSKGEMAYTLVDVDSPASAEVIARIRAIEGVLSVRAIPTPQGGPR